MSTLEQAVPLELADDDHPQGPVPRTALCLRIRQGRLWVFVPPMTHLEHYLELMAALETCAETLGVPLMLEGYEPPEDPRIMRFSLEPDAAVLKLKLPMTADWQQGQTYMTQAYQEAAQWGLSGIHSRNSGSRMGPGGSADLTLGGGEPAQSPFLFRPQLLRSLISCWQQHPSLSYFFAGRQTGPSGTAPRPDEGRADALYELGIALSRMPDDTLSLPWVPDRILRNLLADPAGDIKRAEIRVDQLYDPDRVGQRLGWITLRSLETAQNDRLATAQLLLVRALVASLLRQPVTTGLTPFGSALHDRYMLPGILWEDLKSVLAGIRQAGIPLQDEWYQPFLEARFPLVGQMQLGQIRLELRPAHEPWPILAEEVTAGGVGRFVDSANDRVQVEVFGMTPGRHVLACNGRRVPLQSSGVKGHGIAGVRYKAWNPAATLHPTVLPVYALAFEMMDSWTGKVLGGFTYYPPRPHLPGPVDLPAYIPPEPEGSGEARVHRAHPIALPPISSGGVFEPVRPADKRAVIPPEEYNPRQPYLLNLVGL